MHNHFLFIVLVTVNTFPVYLQCMERIETVKPTSPSPPPSSPIRQTEQADTLLAEQKALLSRIAKLSLSKTTKLDDPTLFVDIDSWAYTHTGFASPKTRDYLSEALLEAISPRKYSSPAAEIAKIVKEDFDFYLKRHSDFTDDQIYKVTLLHAIYLRAIEKIAELKKTPDVPIAPPYAHELKYTYLPLTEESEENSL